MGMVRRDSSLLDQAQNQPIQVMQNYWIGPIHFYMDHSICNHPTVWQKLERGTSSIALTPYQKTPPSTLLVCSKESQVDTGIHLSAED